ncbi:lipopolysaccharide biosynthesis protein [Allomuricauda sp. CP2A]|jgi:O-antigen/teichoic acid export membrane protein|uniref:lipopolysaccharide biosynthesis protein n=1 Tax=Allomuricauda sp. CP2A TaxID=1848189 RepID=UPI0009F69F1B|nr:oligosaccharide flippase family protein [Muricauda sp. CP2A]
MKIQNKSLLLNFSGYTIINLFNSLTPFIVLPILTHNLSSYDIGLLDLFNSSTIFLMPIIGLSLIQSISKLYFVFKDKEKYISVLFTCVFSLGCLAFLLTLFVLYATNLVTITDEKRLLVLSIVFYVFINLLIEGFLLLNRNQENLKQFAFIRLLKSFLEIILTVVLIYYFKDYWARICAILSSAVISSIVVVVILTRTSGIRFEYDKSIVTRVFQYSYPLIFHTFFASILNYADRFFINVFEGTSMLGKYAVAYQLCMVMSLVINSFNMAWAPYYMKNMMDTHMNNFNLIVEKTFRYYIGGLLLFGLFLFLFMPLIYTYYVGADYLVDRSVYVSLLVAYIFNGLYRFKVNQLFYREKTLLVAKLSMITALINLILNYICIRFLGILGAALSTLISYLLLYLLLEKQLSTLKKNEFAS